MSEHVFVADAGPKPEQQPMWEYRYVPEPDSIGNIHYHYVRWEDFIKKNDLYALDGWELLQFALDGHGYVSAVWRRKAVAS